MAVIAVAGIAGRPHDEPHEREPGGLIVTYRDARSPDREVWGIEPSVAIALEAGESPHPRIDPRAWTAAWRGQIKLFRAGKYRFSARVIGRLRMRVAGQVVLEAERHSGDDISVAASELELAAGSHRIEIDYAKSDGPARLAIYWESASFSREPLPWIALSHSRDEETESLRNSQRQDRGRLLAEECGCIACHKPDDHDRLGLGLTRREAPDLSRAGERLYAGWIYQWLADPHAIRPGAVMPRMFDSSQHGDLERHAVAAYLASLGGPLAAPPANKRDDDLHNSRTRGRRLFVRVGCAACHEPGSDDAPPPSLAGLAAKTTPDRLSQYLGNPLAIDPSGRMPGMSLSGQESRDLANWLCATTSAVPKLPASPAAAAVRSALDRLAEDETERDGFQKLSDPARLLALGGRLVRDKGCANCHRIAPQGQPIAATWNAPGWGAIRTDGPHARGCLAPAGSPDRGAAPSFAWPADQRADLAAFLAIGRHGAGAPAPAFAAQTDLERFRCVACHTRGGNGGLTSELVEQLRRFESAQDAEAIAPPPLTEVGAKLRTGYLRDVLVGQLRARPWMGLRMPQFGPSNVARLPEQLAAADGERASDDVRQFAFDAERVEAGRFLVGKKGFGCTSCHDIAGRPNTGTRGPDLASIHTRVRYDWYQRWMDDPQRMQPGTRMPTVFQNGKTAIRTVLDGDAAAQRDAIWSYLSLGANLPLPEGLEPLRGLVVEADKRPLLIRTFMPDAGTRALAIGYPGGVSFAFDAAQCRLAYGWTGGFLEASPIWQNRGGSPARVQGTRFWSSPAVFPWIFADSPATTSLDWAAQSRDPAVGAATGDGKLPPDRPRLKFESYTVSNSDGDVAVHYALHARSDESSARTVRVIERFRPRQTLAGVGVERTFELSSATRRFGWLLVGESPERPQVLANDATELPWPGAESGTEVAPTHHIQWMSGDGPRLASAIAAPEHTVWRIHRGGDKWHTVLRVPIGGEGDSTAVRVIVWSPYRAEPAMIRGLIRDADAKVR